MRNYFLFFFLLLFFNSCQKEVKNNIDTSNIEVEFMINRFEQDFYTNKGDNLEELKKKYPLLFPKNTPDSIWRAKIKDKDEQEKRIVELLDMFNIEPIRFTNLDKQNNKSLNKKNKKI